MTSIRSICVFCGSRSGLDARYTALAEDFGHMLAARHMTLVYGGGNIGLMGTLARAVKAHGGQVIGVIPRHLDQVEIRQTGLDEIHVVEDMHSRKRKMFDLSDAIIALPGAIGTLDETIEVITWRQLGLHDKPIILVNQEGFWNPLLELFRHIQRQGFASPQLFDLFEVAATIHEILPRLANEPAPAVATRSHLL